MNAPDPSERDRAFRQRFLACAAGDEEALSELERLALAGATTSAFTDSELGDENFAMATQDFLRQPSPRKRSLFLRAAELVMQRGPAFITNRAYVGNGGAPAAVFVLSLIAGSTWLTSDSDDPPTHAAQLLELMVKHGLSLREHFWGDFVRSLRPIDDRLEERLPMRLRVIELAEQHGAFELEAGTYDELIQELQFDPITRVLRIKEPQLLIALAECAGRSAWATGMLRDLAVLDSAADALLNPFLSSKQSRRVLIDFAKRFAGVQEWMQRPAVVFALLRKKERSLVQFIGTQNPHALVSARDGEGNSALHVLATVRGKTEKLAELLREVGVDVNAVNIHGETAEMIERGVRRLPSP